MLALGQIAGNVVVVSWLFERAAHWILDRNAITGHVGEVLLKNEDEDEDDSDAEQAGDEDGKDRVIDSRSLKNRKIYCLI